MSESAISNRQLAIGGSWKDSRASSSATRLSPVGLSIVPTELLPIAHCLLPIARSRAAIPCTVTHPDTSVTTLPLVESGLIVVSKANGRWAKTAAGCGFGRDGHCSFQGGMCIQ